MMSSHCQIIVAGYMQKCKIDIPIPSVNGDTSNYPKIGITEFVELENKYFG